MKTAEDTLKIEFDRINADKNEMFKQALYEAKYKNNPVVISAMKQYAREVAGAVRDASIEQARSPLLQERIKNIDINHFIK